MYIKVHVLLASICTTCCQITGTTVNTRANSVESFNKQMSCTYIFIVPLGPRFVFNTFCSPMAALVFTCKAAAARANSALGFNV